MADGIVSRARALSHRTTSFFAHDIWQARLDTLPPEQARRIRLARVLHSTVRGLFFEDALHVRAAALTYYTVLSLVPLLAFAFALLKGFGAYDVLVEETIRPFVHSFLEGNEALQIAFERILGFVDATGVTSLGFIGLLTLLYAATRLLRNIEIALNELWGIEASRGHLAQFRDYVAIIVVTPLCMMAAAALTTAGQALDLLRSAGETLGIGAMLDQALDALGPLVALFMGLTFLYKAMPFVEVRVVSAIIGAVIGSVLWYLVLIAHVRFQVGVARFNALYSSFAALPIFLAWLQLSWLVVLVGGRIAATHQNAHGITERLHAAALDPALRETLCLSAVLRIAGAFVRAEPPPLGRALSDALNVPDSLLAELLGRVEHAGIVVRTGKPTDPAYVLARPPESVRLKQILDALRHAPPLVADALPAALAGDPSLALWRELDRALDEAPANRSLRDVLEGG